MTLAEQWMRDRLPETDDLVLLHGDYRVGNFLFDAESGQFNAVLDWELAHIGDFHEDLGWFHPAAVHGGRRARQRGLR